MQLNTIIDKGDSAILLLQKRLKHLEKSFDAFRTEAQTHPDPDVTVRTWLPEFDRQMDSIEAAVGSFKRALGLMDEWADEQKNIQTIDLREEKPRA